MDFELTWSEPALQDLREIVSYISRHNPEAAERVGHSIVDHVETLRTFPLIDPNYPRGKRSGIREIVHGNYRIFYRVLETQRRVQVLTVWHGARGVPRISDS